jgi:hypothetical protein
MSTKPSASSSGKVGFDWNDVPAVEKITEEIVEVEAGITGGSAQARCQTGSATSCSRR